MLALTSKHGKTSVHFLSNKSLYLIDVFIHKVAWQQERPFDDIFQTTKQLRHRFEKVAFYLVGLPRCRCTAKTQLNSLWRLFLIIF